MSQLKLAAPVSGWLTSVRDVPDPVFSEEMMGVGVAVDPVEGRLLAPFAGKVVLVAATKHSVTLRSKEGAELLIHIGLETVGLEGRGFETLVRDGDKVEAGDLLIRFDLDAVALEAKSLVTPILLTNPEQFRLVTDTLDRLVEAGQPIGYIEALAGQGTGGGPHDGEVRSAEAVIRFEHGLHARPAARIADTAKRFSSSISIDCRGKSANARSPVAIMALNATKGERVQLTATGEDAAEALEAVSGLLEQGEEEQKSFAPAPVTERKLGANEIAGVCALPGIAVGTAVHWRRQTSDAADEGRGKEVERAALEEALQRVRARLEALSQELSGPASAIAQAHVGLLEDEELNASAKAEIERGRSAARAWQLATSNAAQALRQAQNPRLRERISDLEDISSQVIAALAGKAVSAPVELPQDSIVVADELLPSEMMALPRTRVAGLATSGGGATSHMAIIAASLGIPTIVAMGAEVSRVPDGARVLLNASAGLLVIDPDEETERRAREAADQSQGHKGDCQTRDGERVRLLANLATLSDVAQALEAGAEGCGLLRTEFLFLDRSDAPSIDEQQEAYQAFADALEARPLTIRTLDIGGDKPVPYIHFPQEQNPALGARGIRTDLFKPELLEDQLQAIARVTGAIKVMVPMVSSVAELRLVRERFRRLKGDIAFGAMVETPSAALTADQLVKEADFLSIGSNDLAQYALAMDRTNPLLAAAIDALHPAVLRLMAMTAEAANEAGKSVSLCGGLASDPAGALVLLGLGIRELSAVPAAIPAVRSAVGKVSASDCAALAKEALRLESAAQVRALAAELLNSPPEEH